MAQTIKSRQWESALDGISNLKLVEKPIPLPDPLEVLVKIHSVSLNFKDAETIEGLFSSMSVRGAIVPCADAAGIILHVGPEVTKWKVGDRVLSVSYPEYLTGKITQEALKTGIGSTGKGVLLQRVEAVKGLAELCRCALRVPDFQGEWIASDAGLFDR